MNNRMGIFNKSQKWIRSHSLNGKGICVTSKNQKIYPEVTGYYIPTLLQWGERDLAVSFARNLMSIQKADGSWYDPDDVAPYIFDTAQILKGLVAIQGILPEAKESIIRGCDWIIGRMTDEGQLVTPSQGAWGDDDTFCSELIHLYCLTPLVDAGRLFSRNDYIAAANKIKEYYITHFRDRILSFSLLSHFCAYVMEGLWDLGEHELVTQAMNDIKKYQNAKGGIPGLADVKWVCSTGMFQLALVWYKMGNIEEGNKLFNYTCTLQNTSGGWYGCYPSSFMDKYRKGRKKPHYFPDEEIGWANKYFLDALSYKLRLEFESIAHIFMDEIDVWDGRYLLVESEIKKAFERENAACEKSGDSKEIDTNSLVQVCDVGCGKGRYLKNLLKSCPQVAYHAADLSEKVMEGIDAAVHKEQGFLTCIPYEDDQFDVVYTCEALEHAVNLEGAVKELLRITKPGGTLIIIDKPVEKLGRMEIDEWEQWIDTGAIKALADTVGVTLEVVESVSYEGVDDGLFRAWVMRT